MEAEPLRIHAATYMPMAPVVPATGVAPAVITPMPAWWQRPWWCHPAVLSLACLVLIIYGSLLPFDLQWSQAVEAHGGIVAAWLAMYSSPQWYLPANSGQSALGMSALASDLIMNLLLYVPLGVLLRLTLMSLVRNWFVTWLGATVLVLGVSWSMESLQSLSPTRVATIPDILANVGTGSIAALFAVQLRNMAQAMVFWLYRKLARPGHALVRAIRRMPHRPRLMAMAVVLNLLLIVTWYVNAATSVGSGSSDNWLPFYRHFWLPYDEGMTLLGRSLIVYCLLAAMVSLLLVQQAQRRKLRWIVLLIALPALGMEWSRVLLAGRGWDITQPVLAVMGCGLFFVLLFAAIHGLRANCRRKHEFSVDNDRRARRHDYRFALPRR